MTAPRMRGPKPPGVSTQQTIFSPPNIILPRHRARLPDPADGKRLHLKNLTQVQGFLLYLTDAGAFLSAHMRALISKTCFRTSRLKQRCTRHRVIAIGVSANFIVRLARPDSFSLLVLTAQIQRHIAASSSTAVVGQTVCYCCGGGIRFQQQNGTVINRNHSSIRTQRHCTNPIRLKTSCSTAAAVSCRKQRASSIQNGPGWRPARVRMLHSAVRLPVRLLGVRRPDPCARRRWWRCGGLTSCRRAEAAAVAIAFAAAG